jgi:hypothetical protein
MLHFINYDSLDNAREESDVLVLYAHNLFYYVALHCCLTLTARVKYMTTAYWISTNIKPTVVLNIVTQEWKHYTLNGALAQSC